MSFHSPNVTRLSGWAVQRYLVPSFQLGSGGMARAKSCLFVCLSVAVVTSVCPCLYVRSQIASGWLTVGLVDRSAERHEYGMEHR